MEFRHAEAIMHLMGQTTKMHRHNIDLLIREHEVFPGQPPLLIHLSKRDGQSQKELGERMRITPATLTVMINRMQKVGLLKRVPDPSDQRVTRVFLTEKGRIAADAVHEALRVTEEASLAGLDEEDKKIAALTAREGI